MTQNPFKCCAKPIIFWEKLRHDYGKNGRACMWQGFTFPGFELLLLVFYITKVEVTIQLQLIHLSLYNVYDSFSAPIKWVRRGDESQSGQIVLKKVKLTYFDAYLWQTMWNHAKTFPAGAQSAPAGRVGWVGRRASVQAVTLKWHFRTTSPINTASWAGENWFLAKMGRIGAVF